jgi:3-phosphoshikimate 1-carboxyvinyltransferase
METMKVFGLQSKFDGEVLTISKNGDGKQLLDHNFIKEPDTAQSVAVACAGAGKPGIFTGLKTLRIKETDRIAALQKELKKVDVAFVKLPPQFSKKSNKEYFMIEGKAKAPKDIPQFDTYKDHRMAMAFAPLAINFPIIMNEPDVVSKSYPDYWKDLEKLGFDVSTVNSH